MSQIMILRFASLHPNISQNLFFTLIKVLLYTIDISSIMITSNTLCKVRNLHLIWSDILSKHPLIFIVIGMPKLAGVTEILIAETQVGANKRTFTFFGETV